ncbi:zinc ribbon domain-containing protein [Methanobrevibacter woesei]|uniref:zinc ribbon domain-containing protein n=1 Tax=Methanobrevibacter woesei TaxID=190976 RepID=UPI0023F5911A|nr:zinc ribbon domain-containing protein [Methanobrevibacter woesei]
MKCNYCGYEMSGFSKFCSNCGMPILEDQEEESENDEDLLESINYILFGLIIVIIMLSAVISYFIIYN